LPLLYSGIVLHSCHVSYCMLTLQTLQPPPSSYICCLVLSGQPCES
jgi:hypothetical protein